MTVSPARARLQQVPMELDPEEPIPREAPRGAVTRLLKCQGYKHKEAGIVRKELLLPDAYIESLEESTLL